MGSILDVRELETQFRTREGLVHAVNGVSFYLNEGETLGIVGESGCGKSVSMMSLLQLIPNPPGKVTGGQAYFQGNDLLRMSQQEIRNIRGSKISVVFQDPMTSFNPVLTIGDQVSEPYKIHTDVSRRDAIDRAIHYMEMVGIPNCRERINNYPHQFSGGMRQRVMIAMSLICEPQILIADEPTTALDVTIQAQIVDLVKNLRDRLGMSIIWITHDLGIIAGLADRVNVMYGGFIVETAPVKDLYENPQHPYTIGLLGSLPRMDDSCSRRLLSIEGTPPIFYEKPSSCPFKTRCRFALEKCENMLPTLTQVEGKNHLAACWVNPKTGKEY